MSITTATSRRRFSESTLDWSVSCISVMCVTFLARLSTCLLSLASPVLFSWGDEAEVPRSESAGPAKVHLRRYCASGRRFYKKCHAVKKMDDYLSSKGRIHIFSSLQLMNGSDKLECYITLGWKGLLVTNTSLLGPYASSECSLRFVTKIFILGRKS
jgi:hypothetical protein